MSRSSAIAQALCPEFPRLGIPADFPTTRLVTPTQVVYDAPDGTVQIVGLRDEPLAGLPRVYSLAWAFVAHR